MSKANCSPHEYFPDYLGDSYRLCLLRLARGRKVVGRTGFVHDARYIRDRNYGSVLHHSVENTSSHRPDFATQVLRLGWHRTCELLVCIFLHDKDFGPKGSCRNLYGCRLNVGRAIQFTFRLPFQLSNTKPSSDSRSDPCRSCDLADQSKVTI